MKGGNGGGGGGGGGPAVAPAMHADHCPTAVAKSGIPACLNSQPSTAGAGSRQRWIVHCSGIGFARPCGPPNCAPRTDIHQSIVGSWAEACGLTPAESAAGRSSSRSVFMVVPLPLSWYSSRRAATIVRCKHPHRASGNMAAESRTISDAASIRLLEARRRETRIINMAHPSAS